MSDTLILRLDLDNTKFDEKLKDAESKLDKLNDLIEKNIDKNSDKSNKKLARLIDSNVKLLERFNETAEKISSSLNKVRIDQSNQQVIESMTNAAETLASTASSISAKYNDLNRILQINVNTFKSATDAIIENNKHFSELNEKISSFQKADISVKTKNYEIGVSNLNSAFSSLSESIKIVLGSVALLASIRLASILSKDAAGIQKLIFFLVDLSSGLLAFKAISGDVFPSAANSILNFTTAGIFAFKVFLIYAVKKTFDAVSDLGRSIVNFTETAYQGFLKFRQGGLVFNQIIEAFNRNTNGAIGTAEEWSDQIKNLSQSLNLSIDSLQKASAEIIQVGSRIGLNREQMQKLLQVVAEYSRLMGKDVFEASIAFLSGLQGQSQAVMSYGVKLTEAATAQFALKNGLRESFSSLSEGQKIQTRYNFLLKQYSDIAGIAVNLSNDWYAQNEKLNVTLKTVSAEIGKGSALINDFNFVAGLANRILQSLSPSFYNLIGFLSALGGYALMAIGTFLKLSLVFGIVNHQIKLMNLLLQSEVWKRFIDVTLPRLGINLENSAKKFGVANVELTSVSGIFKTLIAIISSKQFSLLEFITGIKGAKDSASLLSIIFDRIRSGIALIIPFIQQIAIALAPIALKAAAISAAVWLIVSAFQEVEKRTQVFGNILNVIKQIGNDLIAIFSETKGIFSLVADGFSQAINRILGLAVFVVSSTISGFVLIAQSGAAIFGKKLPSDIEQSLFKLRSLNDSLLASGFHLHDAASAVRTLASETAKVKFDDFEKLNEILKQIADERKTEVQKIADTMNQRLNIIKNALNAEVLAFKEAENAKAGAIQIAQQKTLDVIRGLLGKQAQMSVEMITADYNKRQQIINQAFNNALITESQFQQFSLDNQRLYNSQMDELYKQNAASKLSEVEKISLAYQISIQQAQAAMDAMNRITGASVNIIAGFMERLGASFVTGGAAFEDFGKFILNILGDLAIQVGVLMTGLGAALQKLAAALANPFLGASVIVAGLALIAIGGLLKALANVKPSAAGVVQNAPIVSGPSGVSPAPIIGNNDLMPRPDAEREQQSPSITINVEGSLFNTEETGRTLVDILSKEFNKKGAKIVKRSFA